MQTKKGSKPKGHIAEEWQEYYRLCLLPKLQKLGEKLRQRHATTVSNAKRDLDWKAANGELVLISDDKDRRHTHTSMPHYRAAIKRGVKQPKLIDRRNIRRGRKGWTMLSDKHHVPTASKVQDCIQQPVECIISPIKRHVHKLLKKSNKRTGRDIVEAVQESTKRIKAESIRGAFNEGEVAIRQFAAPRGFEYKAKYKGKVVDFVGTGGGPVDPRLAH